MQGIIICHHPSNEPFLKDLLASINTKYPVTVSVAGVDRPEDSYELGAIEHGRKLYKEFILLQDTCLILDNGVFEELFSIEGNVAMTGGFYHYIGKYSDLPDVIPVMHSKDDAILWECRWMTKPYRTFCPEIPVHTNDFEQRHGRRNMVCSNGVMTKYKATFYI